MVMRDQQIPEERTLAILVFTTTTWPRIRNSTERIEAAILGIHRHFLPAAPQGPPSSGMGVSLAWKWTLVCHYPALQGRNVSRIHQTKAHDGKTISDCFFLRG
jgi:hypothetical protein